MTGPKAGAPLLSLQDVTARIRDRRILPGTSWTIRAGQAWAVVGPNGAGKSTLLGLLTGATPSVSGKVIRHAADARPQRIGHVSFELLEKLAAREIRAEEARQFSGRLESVTTAADLIGEKALGKKGPAAEVVDRFGIRPLLDRHFTRLSSGELRRVLLVRALAQGPGLLVLDEPFEGLDAESQQALRDAISAMIRSGRTVVLATHRIEALPAGISHVLGIRDGRVVKAGPKSQVLHTDMAGRLFPPEPAEPASPQARPPVPEQTRGQGGTPPLVEMKGVSVSYGKTRVLENIDWTVRKGEHWALLGPNGAGKTTLLSLIAGDHPQAYANRIFLFGRRRGSGESIWDIKRRISLVSFEFQLRYRKPISAMEAVLSGFSDSVGFYRRASAKERQAAEKWLSFVGLATRGDSRFDRLSYGERRRVLLARCLVKNPDLLILDEPCQGLDPDMRARLLSLIERIGRRRSFSLLYVTHHEDEIPACIDHVLRLPDRKRAAPFTAPADPVCEATGSCKSWRIG